MIENDDHSSSNNSTGRSSNSSSNDSSKNREIGKTETILCVQVYICAFSSADLCLGGTAEGDEDEMMMLGKTRKKK